MGIQALLPSGFCLQWQATLMWGNILPNSIIISAFACIALNLAYIYRRRKDIDFRIMLVMFAISITAAGISHFIEMINLWYPYYFLELIFKSISALSATTTAILLLRITPSALTIASPSQWKKINEQLKMEIAEKTKAQEEKARAELQVLELERQAAKRKLNQEEATFRLVTENVRDYAIYMLDKNGDVSTWNKGAERLTGYSESDIIGKNIATFYPDGQVREGDPPRELSKATENGQHLDEGWRVRKNGSKFLANTCLTALRDESGELFGFLQISRDITQQRKISDELRDSEERFRGTFEQAAVGIGHVALEGKFIRINERFSEITGYSKSEMEALSFQDITHPQDLDADLEQLNDLINGKIATYTMDKRYIRKQGSIVWVSLTVSLVRNANGAPKYAISVVQDISSRKDAEDKLQMLGQELQTLLEDRTKNLGDETAKRLATQDILERRESQLRLITSVLPAAVLYIDNQLIYRFCNSIYTSWIQKPQTEIVGKCLKEVVGDRFYRSIFDSTAKVLQGIPVSVDVKLPYNDQTRFTHVDLVPDKDACGFIRGFIALLVDMSANKAMLEELERAKIAADAASQSKSAFLANMSHEIRTPLGAVLGFSELLGSESVTPSDKKTYLSAIKRNGELLSNIIDDILDLSKVEAGKFDIERGRCRLIEVVLDLLSFLKLQAADKGIALIVTTEGPIPDFIWTDALRLRQILINIVGNAIKFTQRGTVEVKVKQVITDQHLKIAFYIKDTGCGLTDEQVKKLFLPFTQADATMKRKFGGTGLGLVLSKKLAIILGGDVSLVESTIGKGSTFLVTIDPGESNEIILEPANPRTYQSDEDTSIDRNQFELDSMKVLLVEDSVDNQLLLKTFLQKSGAIVDFANNGQEALEKINQAPYDVVLMDIQMPIMDGYEATASLRKRGFIRPIIGLSAHAMKEEQSKCLENGFSAYISKPVDRVKLVSVIANQVSSSNLNAHKQLH